MLDAAFIKATTCLGVLDAASFKATTCQESWMPPLTQSTTQLEECQVPLQANNVLSSPPLPFQCLVLNFQLFELLQLFELVHSTP